MLLNYVYKIYAKAISNRMESVMNQLIGPQQTGFIKGHSILMGNYCLSQQEEIPGVIAIVDFEKCFDRIEHKSIAGVMRYFNYGEQFIQMVMLLFSDFYISTQNNGYQFDLFRKSTGINQGCPASPGIYNQTCAIMEHLIKEDSNIRGINMYDLEHILSQFADDTAAFFIIWLTYCGRVLQCFG